MQKQQEEAKAKLDEINRKKDKIIADARQEAREMLKDARETASEVQKELKELAKLESMGERNKRYDKSRKRLREKEDKYAERIVAKVNSNPVSAAEIKVGDRVKVVSLDQNGEVLSLPDEKGDLQVKIGIMKANLNVDDLMLINDGTKKKKPPATAVFIRRKPRIFPSLSMYKESIWTMPLWRWTNTWTMLM